MGLHAVPDPDTDDVSLLLCVLCMFLTYWQVGQILRSVDFLLSGDQLDYGVGVGVACQEE